MERIIGVKALVLAGLLVALASLAHLVCIAVGARAYRFMGAGERMARAVEAGKLKPVIDGPYAFSEVPKPIQYFGKGQHKGKVVIDTRTLFGQPSPF